MRRTSLKMLVLTLLLPACAFGQLTLPSLDGGGAFDPAAGLSGQSAQQVSLELVSDQQAVTAGGELTIGVKMTIAPGWVLYSPSPGPMALAANIEVQAGPWTVKSVRWQRHEPHTTQYGSETVTNNSYHGLAWAFVTLAVPAGATGSQDITIALSGQVCSDAGLCVQVSESGSLSVPVAPQASPNAAFDDSARSALQQALPPDQLDAAGAQVGGGTILGPDVSGLTTWTGLGLALLVGLLLNVMPCVLPVIPLKILSLVHHAQQSHRHFTLLGLAFAGGVVLFFMGLAAFSGVVRVVTSQTLAWGEHFQSEPFRIGMGLFLVAMAMNLFGLFTVLVPNRIAQMSSDGPPRHGVYLQAVGSGVLTAVLSTPCSFGPLATAFVWAQTRPLWLGSLGITAIGVGMALPYVALVAFPQLIRRMPRPGRWMELLKEGMGFVLLAVAIWLLTTISPGRLLAVLAYATVLSFCLWMWGTWVPYTASAKRLWSVRLAALGIAVAAGAWLLSPPAKPLIDFVPFDRGAIDKALEEGRPVLLDFTADWCINCKTLEWQVFGDKAVADAIARKGVLAMKADVTTSGNAADKMLKDELGERGVPLVVLYVPGQPQPVRLREIFASEALLAELAKLPDRQNANRDL